MRIGAQRPIANTLKNPPPNSFHQKTFPRLIFLNESVAIFLLFFLNPRLILQLRS
jgi:hypothetical protein